MSPKDRASQKAREQAEALGSIIRGAFILGLLAALSMALPNLSQAGHDQREKASQQEAQWENILPSKAGK